jgi:hypothetical protein
MVSMINAYRTSKGVAAMTATTGLTRAAISKSQQMAASGTFAHDDIMTTMSRFNACGNSSSSVGENIAAGNMTASATLSQWQNSAEHNANLLSASYTSFGIGRAVDASGYPYWTAEFGNAVDAALPSGSTTTTAGATTQPTFTGVTTPSGVTNQGFSVPATSSSGGTVGYGSFTGSGGVPVGGSILPQSVPVFPYGQGSFTGSNGVPTGGTAPATGGSGTLTGFGSFSGGGSAPPSSGQSSNQGFGSFP